MFNRKNFTGPAASLALILPLTALLACGKSASHKTPETPTVEVPAPVVPAPVEPAPVVPAPVEPAPVVPAPVEPAPVVPAPVEPAPVVPAPVEPAPVVPAPVEPAPVVPAPVEPAPVLPAPVQPSSLRILGTWAACEEYDFSSFSFRGKGSSYFEVSFSQAGLYQTTQKWFTDSQCKIAFTQAAADSMIESGAKFEEQELLDYLNGTKSSQKFEAEAIGANGLGKVKLVDDSATYVYKIENDELFISEDSSIFISLGKRK